VKFELPRNSLFAILLRSPWWVSALVALGVFGVVRLFLSQALAAFGALPFAVIALYAASQELRRPGAGRLAAALERARNLSWDGFAQALEEAFRREGYAATRAGGGVDLELTREGRLTLVGCKRWKAVRTGIEPLREFHAASSAREAQERIYIAAGEVTEQARAFAAENRIRLMQDAELAKLLAKGR